MQTNKKVAIIVPVYNEEDMITRALLGLAGQDAAPREFEIIVVDNNCQDKTIEKVNDFKKEHSQLSVEIIKERKQGIKYARKKGFDLGCRCPYLSTIDADTLVKKNFVSETISTFGAKKADAVVWKLELPWEVMLELPARVRKQLTEFVRKKQKIQQFLEKYFGPTLLGPGYAVTREIYKKTGSLTFGNSPLRYADDIIFSKRILYQGGKIIKSLNSVVISERRLRGNPESYLTGESHWGRKRLAFVRKTSQKIVLDGLQFSQLWKKRLAVSAHLFLCYYLDALLYSQNYPECLLPRKIVTRVENQVLGGEKFKPKLGKNNWPGVLKNLQKKHSDKIISNISKYVKKVDKS